MSNGELQTREESALGRIVITEAQVDLIKHTVAVGASDDELKLFFYECRRRGVHPLDRLIHFVKRGDGQGAKVAFQCGIDFMRSQAEASGEYRGQEDVEYGPMKAIANFPDIMAPEWAKVTVKRRDPETGEIIPTSTTVFWEEFYPGDKMGFMWRKMPRLMLGKVAEAQTLRKAFPRMLQGLYSFEEMEQADIVDMPKKPPIAPPQSKSDTQGQEQGQQSESTVIAIIEDITVKDGKTNDKPWTKYSVTAGGNIYGTFDKKVADQALFWKGQRAKITYKQEGKYLTCLSVTDPEAENVSA